MPSSDFLRSLEDLIKTVSFFNEKRFVVVKNAFPFGDKLSSLMKVWNLAGDKQRIFVFAENMSEAEMKKKDLELFKLLSAKPNLVEVFETLEGKKLENWIVKEFEARNCKIGAGALKKIVSFTAQVLERGEEPNGSLTWRLNQEIEKIANYKSGEAGAVIKEADVELLVKPNIDLNIFKITDAIASKNRALSTTLLHDYLKQNDDPHYIFSMVIFQFRNLLRIKSLIKDAVSPTDIPKLTGLHPYVVKKTCQQCGKFELDELKRLYRKLFQMEVEMKTGKVDLTDGLFQFIFAI